MLYKLTPFNVPKLNLLRSVPSSMVAFGFVPTSTKTALSDTEAVRLGEADDDTDTEADMDTSADAVGDGDANGDNTAPVGTGEGELGSARGDTETTPDCVALSLVE
jgi:hypothetical protein